MERTAYQDLINWKNKKNRKPLILNGARQVGKTWLLKKFGENEYESFAYINCDDTPEMKIIFSDFDTQRLIRNFSSITGVEIIREKTLIVLDEIQEVPNALTALKYFCENAPEYHIIVAGSLLGIGLHEGTGFPVGKVDELSLYPLTFEEFCNALGKNILMNQVKEHKWNELSVLSHTFIELLRQYYYVGGMPAVVKDYCEKQNLKSVRDIQNQILADYKRDFSKHVPKEILPKVNIVWNSIPSQLSKENKKFIYSAIKKGGRAKEFENAIQWLIDAGLVYKVLRVSKIEKPLKFYEDFDAFKLFILDLGLLGAMVDVSAKDVLVNNTAFVEYKGTFTEQYVLQELITVKKNIYYYSKENSNLEIDFIIQKDEVYPIEVKAEENLRSKSLKTVYELNQSLKPCRFSMADYREQDWITNIPLYLAKEWVKNCE
ncbi:MAG: AAA family ATPase [Treponema sp.]|jgi:predicted AAA+ superfamily ATPase|nr:AAA family ATPase [Treponema sp.]